MDAGSFEFDLFAMSKGIVCISGVTGYIGAHVAKEFLEHGYTVRGTVRSLTKKKGVEHVEHWQKEGLPIELVEADLLNEKSWEAACEGADYVIHVASPFVMGVKDKDAHEALHKPAREGTLNVLQAALAKGIKKVVVTSSVAAIMAGHEPEKFEGAEPETIWTNLDAKGVEPYYVSKTIAEKAAWEFYEKHKDDGFNLATINPTLVMGPPVSTGSATSHEFISKLIRRAIPAVPNMKQDIVDVRDVAKAHRIALENEDCHGERFVCIGKHHLPFPKIATIVKKALKDYGYRITTIQAPNIALQVLALFDSTVRTVRDAISAKHPTLANDKIRRVLKMEFIPYEQTIEEHAHALIQLGVDGIKMTKKYREALESGEIAEYKH